MTKLISSCSLALALALAVSCLAPSVARAEGDDAASFTGTWKRDGEPARLVRLDFDAASGELVGKVLNPPEGDAGKPYSVDVRLKLDGKKLEGRATWGEENPEKAKAGQPERFTADARWEFDVESSNKLTGRCEAIFWDQYGKVDSKEWEPHTFERVPSISLAGNGVGPDKVEAGVAIDAAALSGAWRAPQGWAVVFNAADGGWNVARVSGAGDFPESLHLANDGNVLKGAAKFAGGVETAVELKLASPGHLEGRAERAEGDKKSWSPLSLERLTRVDGATDATAEPAPLAAGSGTQLASLVWKREDGLYLSLTATDGGSYKGTLVRKGAVRELLGDVSLAPADGKLVGKVLWTTPGGEVAAKWELALQADGTIDARCEWCDYDPATKAAVAHGVVARKFKALRKVG